MSFWNPSQNSSIVQNTGYSTCIYQVVTWLSHDVQAQLFKVIIIFNDNCTILINPLIVLIVTIIMYALLKVNGWGPGLKCACWPILHGILARRGGAIGGKICPPCHRQGADTPEDSWHCVALHRTAPTADGYDLQSPGEAEEQRNKEINIILLLSNACNCPVCQFGCTGLTSWLGDMV